MFKKIILISLLATFTQHTFAADVANIGNGEQTVPSYTKETTYVQNLYTSISNGSITPTPVYSTGAINVYFAELASKVLGDQSSLSTTPTHLNANPMLLKSKTTSTTTTNIMPPSPPSPIPSIPSETSNNTGTTTNNQPPLPVGFGN